MDDLECLIKVLGRKGAIEILKMLAAKKEMNFNKLADKLDDHDVTVSRALKALVKHNLVHRQELNNNLKTVLYSLTDSGRRVKNILEQLIEPGEQPMKPEVQRKSQNKH